MEAAGLAVGVLSIAGLFTSCIENFDLVVRGKSFGEDFDLLCTQLSLQQARLVIWGESLSLVPSPYSPRRSPYDHALRQPPIKEPIEAALNHLLNLLNRADAIAERYVVEDVDREQRQDLVDSKGMMVFRETFDRFKRRIRKQQQQSSKWKVTRWAVHDFGRFKELVENVTKILDSLESITTSLGVLARQRALLSVEIESLSDHSSVALLQRVGASPDAPASLRSASDAASIRLTVLTSSSRSWHTARSHLTDDPIKANREHYVPQAPLNADHNDGRITYPLRTTSYKAPDGKPLGVNVASKDSELYSIPEDIPQHERWMHYLISRHGKPPEPSTFSSRQALQYGKALEEIKDADDQKSSLGAPRLAQLADQHVSLARRLFVELRNIRRAKIPYISAAPVGDALDRLLASIEGPPGTPYEGGIFWITVLIINGKPPLFRFMTRVYHPNIDHTGKICADYETWWRDSTRLNATARSNGLRQLPWFSEGMTGHCSLGALLVALCGLLSSPNLEDPLVPEIAEKYLTDHEGYCEAARKYTIKYASTQAQPNDEELVFPTEGHSTIEPYFPPTYQPKTGDGSLAPRSSRSGSNAQLMDLYNLSEPDLKISMTALSTHAPWAEEEESVNV